MGSKRFFCAVFLSVIFLCRFNAQVCINEFLTSNIKGIVDEDNDYSNWLELYNKTDTTVDLNGYSLTDDNLIKDKWIFPEVIMPQHSNLLLFASGKDRRIPHVTYQTIIDMGDDWQYKIPSADIGTAWTTTGFDTTGWLTGKSGFGYGDGDDSTVLPIATISVFIRKEFTLSNIGDIANLLLHVDFDDGFVAYLNGHEIARDNLGTPGTVVPYNYVTGVAREASMYLGGSPTLYLVSNPRKFLVNGVNVIALQGHNSDAGSSDLSLIPILTVGRAGEGYTEHLSPYIHLTIGKNLHTNFLLDTIPKQVYLYSPARNLLDAAGSLKLINDISYGRKPDGSSNWYYFATPTPGSLNTTQGVGSMIIGNPVVFSTPGGKHIGGVNLTLSTLNPADNIYYTLNGSLPTQSSNHYTGVIHISSSCSVEARAFSSTTLPGPVCSNTYITDINHDLPIICVSTDSLNLWDDNTGILVLGPNADSAVAPNFGANFWQDWEKPAHIEFYDNQGTKFIDQDAGIKVFGSWSRANPQKSLAITCRKEYGENSFDYKFFSDKTIDKFKSIVLRNGGNDYYYTRMRDEFTTQMASEMDLDRQAFQPAAFYLNGKYWGLMNIREKVNEHFFSENDDVDKDSVNLLQLGGDTLQGSNADYLSILDFLSTNTTLQNDDKYNWVAGKIDLDNYIQYNLTEIYINNGDWPGNNIKFWNTRVAGSKWRWILYDTDFGYGLYDNSAYSFNTLQFALEPNGPGWPNPPWSTLFFRRMVTNLKFRNNFINQYADRLNTTFLPDIIGKRIDSLKALYNLEIQYHLIRWGGSYDFWLGQVDAMKVFGQQRPAYARTHLQEVFNLSDQLNVKVEVSDINAGRVKVNTVYPKAYPFNGIYFKNLPIKLMAVPKPGYKFVKWEGTNNSTDRTIDFDMAAAGNFKAYFEEAAPTDRNLVINEINYSSSSAFDTKDWIEIMNNGVTTVDLTGWHISDSEPDSGLLFPSGMALAPDEYLVICKNLKDFRTIHPDIHNSIGDFPFGLSSEGDAVRLYDEENKVMDAVDYYIDSPWPENADGTGNTIELINPTSDNTKGINWKGSNCLGGTPGAPNSWDSVTNIETYKLNENTTDFECFPNPFNDFTTIQFKVNSAGNYLLEVVDLNGRLVSILAKEYLNTGIYYIDWFGKNQNGEYLPAGVYNIRLSNKNFIENIKTIKLN
jgi:hypothetical protein